MSHTSILLILLSAAIHVTWNVLTKSSASPRTFSFLKGLVIIAIAALVLPALPVLEIPGEVWGYIVVSGIIHAVYILALSTAYETGDISFVYPIARSAPALVPIAAFFLLDERISLRGAGGIATVVACVFLLQFREGAAGSELARFWRSLRRKDSVWAFVTLGSVISYTLVDKMGMVELRDVAEISRWLHAPLYFLLECTIADILFSLYMLTQPRPSVRDAWRKEWRGIIVAAVGSIASYCLILYVMQTETVSYIVTLRQSSVLLAVLVGWLILREPYGRMRVMAATAMLLGFYLVATA